MTGRRPTRTRCPPRRSQIQSADPRISNGTLSTRLRELRETRLVDKVDDGYALTSRGEEPVAIGHPLADWSRRWASDL